MDTYILSVVFSALLSLLLIYPLFLLALSGEKSNLFDVSKKQHTVIFYSDIFSLSIIVTFFIFKYTQSYIYAYTYLKEFLISISLIVIFIIVWRVVEWSNLIDSLLTNKYNRHIEVVDEDKQSMPLFDYSREIDTLSEIEVGGHEYGTTK